MISNAEFLDKCRSNQPITCEDLGLPEWRNHTDGTVYICGGYTIYKMPDGYRHESGKICYSVSKAIIWIRVNQIHVL